MEGSVNNQSRLQTRKRENHLQGLAYEQIMTQKNMCKASLKHTAMRDALMCDILNKRDIHDTVAVCFIN